jgi:hypothetical protein
VRRPAPPLAHCCDYADEVILVAGLVRRIDLLAMLVIQLYGVSNLTDFECQLCSLYIVWLLLLPRLSHVRTLKFAAYEGNGASIARIALWN